MFERLRHVVTAVLSPIAKLLLRMGITPNAVTFVGTVGVCAGALGFFPRGELLVGVLVITAFVFSDLIDGHMARSSGQTSVWGSFLDSTLDRIGDAAVFGGLALWFAWGGDDPVMVCVALWCLVMGAITSYARAKAESLGLEAKGGIAERSDRLVVILAMTGLSELLDAPILLPIALWALAAASTVTVIQRMLMVRRQALDGAGGLGG